MTFNLQDQEEIIKHYGIDNQLTIHMEECAELIQVINKCRRIEGEIPNFEYQHLVEEISDVIVCIGQLQHIFNISDYSIEYVANAKIERQKRRMLNENKRNST